ncbi:hypothetical protein [Massilia sp. CF038]|uniref:hypothetical protein n=1 Tax=Massilia sp. CF038 TaxID=1881045 RepID=UPI00091AEE68|nr:hypothetical protein [Massilia sp. CF038]SHH06465.1 hypothetical protein SAMN05428948_2588 [Massilia sp. CF038]
MDNWYLDEAEDEAQGIDVDPDFDLDTFLAWRAPRYGSANPTRMDNPVWTWLVRTRLCGFRANETFDGPSSFEVGPCWSFQRFGQAQLALDDGSLLFIGGEHEDYYDPDFYIYNDVVLVRPDGSVEVYVYPREVFEPTDFHSATRVGDQVIIVGAMGHEDARRFGSTPVYLLSLTTFAITRVVCGGAAPGWLCRHAAQLSTCGSRLLVTGGERMPAARMHWEKNLDQWQLDLGTWEWHCTQVSDWQRCILAPVDRKPNHLFAFRTVIWEQERWSDSADAALAALTGQLGMAPDLALFEARYCFDGAGRTLAWTEEDDYNVFRVVVDGIVLRVTEGGCPVSVVVEGRLAAGRFEALMASLAATFTRLTGRVWAVQQSA